MKKFSDITPVPGYEHLEHVLVSAYLQAAVGKGAERHADDKPFPEQPMQLIAQSLGSVDGMLFQVNKKLQESRGLPDGRRQAEVLGAIVYSAGVHIAYDTWFSNAEPVGCPPDEEWIVGEWFKWTGAPLHPPMPADGHFQVRYRSGHETDWLPTDNARLFDWSPGGHPRDIVAYRTRVKA